VELKDFLETPRRRLTYGDSSWGKSHRAGRAKRDIRQEGPKILIERRACPYHFLVINICRISRLSAKTRPPFGERGGGRQQEGNPQKRRREEKKEEGGSWDLSFKKK